MTRLLTGRAWRWALPTLIGVVLIGLAVLLWVRDYMAEERVFYFWDSRFYHDLAVAAWHSYRQSWSAWWAHLDASMAGDYNALFSVPLMPIFQRLGDSRTVYILGLVACYVLPAALFAGWLAARLSPDRRLLAGWLAGLTMLAQPALWTLTLLGLPGVGAVLLLGLAAAAYLLDTRLSRWWTPVLVGVFTALAILFRRHYGYAGVALFLAMGLCSGASTLLAARRRGEPGAVLVGFVGRLALAPLALLGTMLALAPWFTREALTTDYGALYAGYQFQVGEVLQRWRDAHGDLLLGLGALGIGMALWRRRLSPAAGGFLGLWVLFWGGQWALLVRQIGAPHVVHVLPLVSSLGLGVGAVAAWQRPWSRVLTVVMVVAPALALGHLFSAGDGALDRALKARGSLFGLPPRPSRLHAVDYQEYLALGAYLQTHLAGEPGYVAASSAFLNESLLDSVLRRLTTPGPRPQILPTAHLDSRDWVPLPQLLEAHWVLVASPPLLHLAPEAQTLISASVALFERQQGLARDFRPLPRVFEFQDFTARVYRRVRPTPVPRARETLDYFQRELGAPPGIQTAWVGLDNAIQVRGLPGEPVELRVALDGASPSPWPLLLSWGPARGRTLRGEAWLDGCAAARLAVVAVDEAVEELAVLPLTDTPTPLALALAVDRRHILLSLHLAAPLERPCLLGVDGLRLDGP